MISTTEREIALEDMASSKTRLLGLVDGLTAEQWAFRESPERWSIAETLEHVITVEARLGAMIAKKTGEAPAPDQPASDRGQDALVKTVGVNRTSKFNAPEAVRPTGKWPDAAGLIAAFCETRAKTVEFTATTEADLRSGCIPHPVFGNLDCYQWLLLLSQHAFRHACQIDDIKANPAYPVKVEASEVA